MIKIHIIPKESTIRAMNVYPFLFINVKYKDGLPERTINHERIHTWQTIELAFVGITILTLFGFGAWSLLGYFTFLSLYAIEWLVRSLLMGRDAYHYVSFEKEAYGNDDDTKYLEDRKPFSFIRYI